MIGGFAKAYELPINYVLYEVSYVNVLMYGAILPTYNKSKDNKAAKAAQKIIRADDPQNKEEMRRFLENCD